MALIVGNLLTDAAAQSFISADDADAYLEPEQIETWDISTNVAREAALVRASRWLVATYTFVDDADPVRLGHVAARLAAETIGRPLFAGIDTGAIVESERVGPIAVTYATGRRADAAGMAWPWLKPMLRGLIRSGNTVPVLRA